MGYLVQANTTDAAANHGAAYDLDELKKWLKGFDPAALRHGDSVRIEVDDTREPATSTARTAEEASRTGETTT